MIKIYINNHVVSLTNEFIKNRNKAGIWLERYKPSMVECVPMLCTRRADVSSIRRNQLCVISGPWQVNAFQFLCYCD